MKIEWGATLSRPKAKENKMFDFSAIANVSNYIGVGLQALQVLCKLEAAKVANDYRRERGLAQAYGEEYFLELDKKVENLREKL